MIGLFAEDGFDRRLGTPTQLEMTQVALNFRNKSQNCNGFLMSEGSQIDWAGHDNDAQYMLIEFADFDATVRLRQTLLLKIKILSFLLQRIMRPEVWFCSAQVVQI